MLDRVSIAVPWNNCRFTPRSYRLWWKKKVQSSYRFTKISHSFVQIKIQDKTTISTSLSRTFYQTHSTGNRPLNRIKSFSDAECEKGRGAQQPWKRSLGRRDIDSPSTAATGRLERSSYWSLKSHGTAKSLARYVALSCLGIFLS